MSLSNFTLIDTVTGTVLDPLGCVLIEDSKAPTIWHDEGSLSDSEIQDLGTEHGAPLSRDFDALNRIAELLYGSEWDADLILQIAEIVKGTGREVSDL